MISFANSKQQTALEHLLQLSNSLKSITVIMRAGDLTVEGVEDGDEEGVVIVGGDEGGVKGDLGGGGGVADLGASSQY
ncbi:hypothetical protein Sjap_011995 [Stephania japonica]|uniref:Uncharacterized protein n=1 Tax=Stephania japonica TaxID=461633 RepID=A0AAP0JEG8_9MAGN